MDRRDDILKALQRMQRRGHENNIHYKDLRYKYIMYCKGKAKIINVTEETIGEVGGLIGKLTKETLLKKGGL